MQPQQEYSNYYSGTDVASAAEFVVEVEKLNFAAGGGVELDSVSVEMRKTCLDEAAAAADFVEAVAADLDLASVDNEAAAAAEAVAADQKK